MLEIERHQPNNPPSIGERSKKAPGTMGSYMSKLAKADAALAGGAASLTRGP
jgi:hypothetical protein